ncbi:MAG: IscS subfamily cysteine desulfurase [Rhodovibrionaceae bacterium]|nr:IscS subfamily cysteine desulfurase [Rhodovibrionaceae bacterium]
MTQQAQPKAIYLDYQATTPTDPRVVETMLPYFNERFGNPHSVEHAYGWQAEEAVDAARADIAGLIGAQGREIIFTSGATESNNLAIKGAARFQREHFGKDHVVTVATEHKCVLESARALEREGFRVTFLPVDADGLVDLDRLKKALDQNTVLVSVMAANNEIGVIQPLAEIGALCHAQGVTFHTDAAQAFGKIPLDVDEMNIGLMSISGHKIYGPKGIGALYVRRRPRVRLTPLFDGGGQERGLRSGTVPVPLAVGLGKAAAIAREEMSAEAERLTGLRTRLVDGLRKKLEADGGTFEINGHPEERLPGNLNLRFAGVDGRAMIERLEERLALSSGSACSSAAVEPSYVLKALGLSEEEAAGSLRVGLGRTTTEAEVDAAVDALADTVRILRKDAKTASDAAE